MAKTKVARRPYDQPSWRRLRVYAFDPSLDLGLDTALVNQTFIKVPWEEVEQGPKGEYLEVIDIDPANNCCYEPVDLDDPSLLAQDGLMPSTGDPRFHQQMVYAVAMTTIRHFESALGRSVMWASDWKTMKPTKGNKKKYKESFVRRLRIYPHAMPEENAYYDPDKVALLFGYFRAEPKRTSKVLPQGVVFTCLSHDVISHETTHAILDGLHPRFAEATNPDVLAFHEAFADLVALFQHFTFPEVLKNQINSTRGDLRQQNLLAELAREFAQGTGQYGALRDAIGDQSSGEWKPTVAEQTDYTRLQEPHQRGSALVGAVFDAFEMIYKARTADLLRLASGGTGVLASGELQPDLVSRLAQEAAATAEHILQMCIRALDYCPPVDITFGEYLRAMVTADYALMREDGRAYRTAMIEAFRRRGIYPNPRDVKSLSETSLRWEEPNESDQRALSNLLGGSALKRIRDHLSNWEVGRDRQQAWDATKIAAAEFHTHLSDRWQQAQGNKSVPGIEKLLGLDFTAKPAFEVHSVRPARRLGMAGQQQIDLVIELTQSINYETDYEEGAQGKGPFMFRGGCTLLLNMDELLKLKPDELERPDLGSRGVKVVRYAIRKHVDNTSRMERQWAFVQGELNAGLQQLYFGRTSGSKLPEPFAMVHRLAALEQG